MCFANAAVAAANLRDNFCIQPLIKERCSAWMTSYKMPEGCGKGPASKCGLILGPAPAWVNGQFRFWVQLSPAGVWVVTGDVNLVGQMQLHGKCYHRYSKTQIQSYIYIYKNMFQMHFLVLFVTCIYSEAKKYVNTL